VGNGRNFGARSGRHVRLRHLTTARWMCVTFGQTSSSWQKSWFVFPSNSEPGAARSGRTKGVF
jgi:hypothetical protein